MNHKILELGSGNALVFASKASISQESVGDSSSLLSLRIRPRLTADFGSSRTNTSAIAKNLGFQCSASLDKGVFSINAKS